MAEHGALEAGSARTEDYSPENYAARRRTYLGFLRLIKWSIVGIALVLVFLVWYAAP
jgi:hypothetical protein